MKAGKKEENVSAICDSQIFGGILNEMLTTPILALNCLKKTLLSYQNTVFEGRQIDLL